VGESGGKWHCNTPSPKTGHFDLTKVGDFRYDKKCLDSRVKNGVFLTTFDPIVYVLK
jgi:hypothetical protein